MTHDTRQLPVVDCEEVPKVIHESIMLHVQDAQHWSNVPRRAEGFQDHFPYLYGVLHLT